MTTTPTMFDGLLDDDLRALLALLGVGDGVLDDLEEHAPDAGSAAAASARSSEAWSTRVQVQVEVRASAIARAHRDEMGRISLQLKAHAERLPVSQAYGWRFKPM